MTYAAMKNKLHTAITDKVYLKFKDQDAQHKDTGWLFDFRKIILTPEYSNLIADIFWETYKDSYPFQVGGLETASIPLISAIVTKSLEREKPINGFFIRKSRKKHDLANMIEGNLTDEPVILVDDLINSGKSFMKCFEALDQLQLPVRDMFTLVRFRESTSYYFIKNRNVTLTSLFTLPDFNLDFLESTNSSQLAPYTIDWYFKSKKPNLLHVIPKSAPILDSDKLYVGSDNGYFWALNQIDGTVAWKKKVGWHPKGKAIFSTPALCDDIIYFGAYDGNVYALATDTGATAWMFMEADWIGSSPTIAKDLGLLFIGLEFGLFKKQGGVVALDLKTGKKVWEHITPEMTHCSPAYDSKTKTIAIGSNDAISYLYNAKSGKLKWQHQMAAPIKGKPVYDSERKQVLFPTEDGNLYFFSTQTGEVLHTFKADFALFGIPEISNDHVYVTSADKTLYKINLTTYEKVWSFKTTARILSSPKVIGNYIYIGSNDARLFKIDMQTGKEVAFFQVTERITNKIAYNPVTGKIFLPTFANEVYCLSESTIPTNKNTL